MFRLSEQLVSNLRLELFLTAICCLAMSSCNSTSLPAQPEDQATGHLSVAIKLGKVAAANISRAEIVVTGRGMTEIRQDLTVSGDTVTGTVTGIPAGSDRLFTLNGYDASGILTYTGSATATVIAGQQVTVRIVLRPTGFTGSEKEITVTLPGGVTMEFVWIEPGTFLMGSAEAQGRSENEGPQHQVTISRGFYLGKYEVTQEQYETVTGQAQWVGRSKVQSRPDGPAVYISWDNVQEFISALNTAAGDSRYRLPTEAEWEYACRAGTTTKWSFGDDGTQLGEYAWVRQNTINVGAEYAHVVGGKKPNPWGLYDMHGNVWEWCQDRFELYSSEPQVDPTGPPAAPPGEGDYRVKRGGGFQEDFSESAARIEWPQGSFDNTPDLGARLVRIGTSQ